MNAYTWISADGNTTFGTSTRLSAADVVAEHPDTVVVTETHIRVPQRDGRVIDFHAVTGTITGTIRFEIEGALTVTLDGPLGLEEHIGYCDVDGGEWVAPADKVIEAAGWARTGEWAADGTAPVRQAA